jgi:hypothetical protein
VPLSVKLIQPGTNVVLVSATSRADGGGRFTVTGLPSGTYDVEVKHAQSLSRRAGGMIFAAGVVTSRDFGTLGTGDVNNDNVVTILDFSLLSASFGLMLGQAGFDARADLNANETVDIGDFSLLSINFGQAGPVVSGGGRPQPRARPAVPFPVVTPVTF